MLLTIDIPFVFIILCSVHWLTTFKTYKMLGMKHFSECTYRDPNNWLSARITHAGHQFLIVSGTK